MLEKAFLREKLAVDFSFAVQFFLILYQLEKEKE